MSFITRLFSKTPEAERIRAGEARIADELHALADDLAAHREQRREVLGLPPVVVKVNRIKSVNGKAEVGT